MAASTEAASRSQRWLSYGLATLAKQLHEKPSDTFDFDVVIVGSGYGGSIAAAELAGCTDETGAPLRICVLERGKEYLAGMFPARQADAAGHMRFVTPDTKRQRGIHDGLYDMRWSGDAVALVASGLGGGSLINAGVMELPLADVFREARWPAAIRHDKDLFARVGELRDWLGAKPIAAPAPKTEALCALAGGAKFDLPHVTVASTRGLNSAKVELDECRRCGDCAAGCNHNAKDSLDLNLLRLAREKKVEIYTGATVLRLAPSKDGAPGWTLAVNHTDKQLRDRQLDPIYVRARRVILAAGTFGSTEILMRSRSADFEVSAQLGRKFSANGDMIAIGYGLNRAPAANTVADETVEPAKRDIGPTITGMIDLRTGDAATDVVIQDLAVPGPLRRLFEESTTTANVINSLADGDFDCHCTNSPRPDDAAVEPEAIKQSLVVAMIGRDDAEGELTAGSGPICEDADGMLTVRWPELRLDRRFDKHHERLERLLKPLAPTGRVINNMIWRPFSTKLEDVFGRQRGPQVTVHPLGGCAMGDDIRQGVTDHCGRVFKPAPAAAPHTFNGTHDGLVVLDGAIIPSSLGINPALTISLLSLRAITKLKDAWKLTPTTSAAPAATRRPVFTTPSVKAAPIQTEIELTEQMRGRVRLCSDKGTHSHPFEFTLTSAPTKITDLMSRDGEGHVLPVEGHVRILHWDKNFNPVTGEIYRPEDVAVVVPFTGKLTVFELESSNPVMRTLRALWAWSCNRGWRDITQKALKLIRQALRVEAPEEGPAKPLLTYIREYIVDIVRLCSRAGAVRTIAYDFTLDKPNKLAADAGFTADMFTGKSMRGVKRLTYSLGASPLSQLVMLSLKSFPRMPWLRRAPILVLNPRYLARRGVPLMRVVKQQNRISALSDLFAFTMYTLRVVLQTHALTFRKPDPPSERPAQRLPNQVPGLPIPQIDWLTLDGAARPPIRIRLARYHGRPKQGAAKRPILLIHGYSASSASYAHPAVPGNLAATLYADGRDVWVLDMRSSAGLPTATGEWAFEDMAREDIPAAISHVIANTEADKVDVVAHCMGAAMFSMAVLGEDGENVSKRIGRVVFSQVGPVMILSAANVLRAYIMRYVRQFLALDKYEFSPKGDTALAGQLLDRALSASPIPYKEYRIENPIWPPGKATPWVGTRHRMDALYARTFALANLSSEVLDCIDDFFGPLSVETVSQVIHFARFNTITDRTGVNSYVTPKRIKDCLTFPMMSIHGAENGLSDVATLALMRDTLRSGGVHYLNPWPEDEPDPARQPQSPEAMNALIEANKDALRRGEATYMTWHIAGHGHQDCLIGKKAGTISGVITKYLGA